MKVLVTTMAILIVLGLALVAYGLFVKDNPSSSVSTLSLAGEAEGTARAGAGRRVPFGTVTLNQAPGTQITAMIVASQCIILHMEGGEQGERVIVVDIVSGRVLGTVTVGS